MAELSEKIYEQALDLSVDDRLTLIDKLVNSTNLPTNKTIDLAWSDEVELRSREFDKGKSKLIPGDEVLKKIKKRFTI